MNWEPPNPHRRVNNSASHYRTLAVVFAAALIVEITFFGQLFMIGASGEPPNDTGVKVADFLAGTILAAGTVAWMVALWPTLTEALQRTICRRLCQVLVGTAIVWMPLAMTGSTLA